MKYLLDTHALLWWMGNDARLSKEAKSVISNLENEIYVSSISSYEISYKHNRKESFLPDNFLENFQLLIAQEGFIELNITSQQAIFAGAINSPHRDPFDRMLAAQAIVEGMILITVDKAVKSIPKLKTLS